MNMKAIAQRLMDAGHFLQVVTAGRYACFRSWDLTVKLSAPTPEVQELFDAIGACDDGHDLEELHAFIEPEYVNWGEPVDIAA